MGGDQRGAIDAADREMPPAAVKRHIQIGVATPRYGGDVLDRTIEPVELQSEMLGFVVLSCIEHDCAALAHRRRAEQIIGIVVEGHVLRRRPLARRSCAGLGAPSGAKYPAAFFAAISTCASFGTRRSGNATRSTISIPCACTAPCFMFDIDTQRSMRRTPSQWKTSGTNSWKRTSCTPATHSVRSK